MFRLETLLKRLSFNERDIAYILKCNKICGTQIAPISAEYMAHSGKQKGRPYTVDEHMSRRDLTFNYLERANMACDGLCSEYTVNLLFWLWCIPFAEQYYKVCNISDSIFVNTMSDLACKVGECKGLHGICGVCSEWFYLHFDYLYFGLGRLQFYIERYNYKPYTFGTHSLQAGDRVYSCHIPVGNRLSSELCMDSFHRAYDFFKSELKDTVIPITCCSWILFPGYVGKVFPEGSNIEKFAAMFDIVDTIYTGRKFFDCYRIFGKNYEGNCEGFPCDNTLRRNFIRYINSGDEFGYGVGVILYDSERREIINSKQN